MAKELRPYDPNQQSGSDRPNDERSGEQVHYHYYDQRTFVHGALPGDPVTDEGDGEDEEQVVEPKRRPSSVWVFAIMFILGMAVIVALRLGGTTVTTTETNVVDITPTQSDTDTNAVAAEPTNVRDMLASGQGTACSQPEVRETVIRAIRPPKASPNYVLTTADIQAGNAAVSFVIDTISLAGVNTSVGSVTCDANLVISDGTTSKSFPIRYDIRPSVEDTSSFIVNAMAPGAADYAEQAIDHASSAAWSARGGGIQDPENPPSDAASGNGSAMDVNSTSDGE